MEEEIFQAIRTLTAILRSKRVPYVLVGAFAFGALGGARGTLDVDFMIMADSSTLGIIKDLAVKRGFEVDLRWARFNPMLKDTQTRLLFHGVPVDILLPRDAHDEETLERRKRKRLGGSMLWFPTPEDFILQKAKVGRPRDFEDALIILKYYHKSIDRSYLDHWAKIVGASEEVSYLLSLV